jgi:hypothetical protein
MRQSLCTENSLINKNYEGLGIITAMVIVHNMPGINIHCLQHEYKIFFTYYIICGPEK